MRSLPPCPLFPFYFYLFPSYSCLPSPALVFHRLFSVLYDFFTHSRSFLVLLSGQKNQKPPARSSFCVLLHLAPRNFQNSPGGRRAQTLEISLLRSAAGLSKRTSRPVENHVGIFLVLSTFPLFLWPRAGFRCSGP